MTFNFKRARVRGMTGLILAVTFAASNAVAGPKDFGPGTVIPEFGPVAKIDSDMKLPRGTYKISFDTAKAAKPGELNKTLESAARLINMHGDAGLKPRHTKIAVVVHGSAGFDLVNDDVYGKRYDGKANKNAALIKALLKNNTRVILCGQSAAYHGVNNEDLLPGVEMAVSAMTAHAVLQKQGYGLNPF